MNYFTTNSYELKREIVNFSKKMSNGLNKPNQKFISDMIFGINSSKDLKISNIARGLHEDINLDNTIERLCLHLDNFDYQEIINANYYSFVRDLMPDYPVVIFDDSDIVKEYGKKFEDLDMVMDGSDKSKKIKPGYHMCNVVALTKETKQPMPIYNKVYSARSKGFVSANTETYKSIDEANKCLKRKYLGVMDRGYDDLKVFNYIVRRGNDYLIRLRENRVFYITYKPQRLSEIYEDFRDKAETKMKVMFQNEEKEVTIAYTEAVLKENYERYRLIFVYGLGEVEKMMLITNKKIESAEEAIKLVRIYLDRWRIETYHREIKVEYKYEDIRIRSLKGINNLTLIFKLVIGEIVKLTEEMNTRLLSIKIIEESLSLRGKIGVWISQFAGGIRNILSRCQKGIRGYFKVREREVQLSLRL